MSTSEEEDEETTTSSGGPRGRPNRWFADHKDDAPDSFTGAFRGVPAPRRGGQQTVKPEDVHGSLAYCWCEEPADHDWPGKAGGAPHPKKGTTMTETIDRRVLRAYHSTLQQFILHAVNEVGLRYRMGTNKVLLYPPDGTRPLTVHARNSESQVNSLVKWWREHVPDPIQQAEAKGEVTPETVAALAQRVNSPEHQVVAKKVEPEKPVEKVEPVKAEVSDDEWVPYITTKGRVLMDYETNGTTIRCVRCLGTDHEWSTNSVKSISGHTRTRHQEVDDLYGEEAQEKKRLTRDANRTLRTNLSRIIDDLIRVTDHPVGNEDKVKELEAQVRKERARADEAEARLALIKESLNV